MSENKPQRQQSAKTVRVGVGAVIFRGDEVLLIKRGKPPMQGQWSIPGGGLEYGESLRDGIAREVLEETGCMIEITGLIDVFEALPSAHSGAFPHTIMIDYVGRWLSGEPVAGDDAAEAAFVPLEEALERLSWDETRRAVQLAAAKR